MDEARVSIRPGSDLDEITKTIPSSFIPLDKPVAAVNIKPELYRSNSVIWQQKSEALLNDYKTGWNIALYNDSTEITTEQLFAKLGSAIITSVSQEFNKVGQPSQSISEINALVQIALNMLGKALAGAQLRQHDSKSVLAFLHGFIDSYINQKVKEK